MFINVLSKRTREISHRKQKKKGPEQSKNCQLNNEEAGRGRGLLTQAQMLDIFGLKVAVDSQTAWQTEVPMEGRRDGQCAADWQESSYTFRKDID